MRITLPKKNIGKISVTYNEKKLGMYSKFIKRDLEIFRETSAPRLNLKYKVLNNSDGDIVVILKEKGLFNNKKWVNTTNHEEIQDHGIFGVFYSAFSRLYNDLRLDKLIKTK